jgi:hypothetical protein
LKNLLIALVVCSIVFGISELVRSLRSRTTMRDVRKVFNAKNENTVPPEKRATHIIDRLPKAIDHDEKR